MLYSHCHLLAAVLIAPEIPPVFSALCQLTPACVQVPVFVAFVVSIRSMANLHWPGFDAGGTLWFQDLTAAAWIGSSGQGFSTLLHTAAEYQGTQQLQHPSPAILSIYSSGTPCRCSSASRPVASQSLQAGEPTDDCADRRYGQLA